MPLKRMFQPVTEKKLAALLARDEQVWSWRKGKHMAFFTSTDFIYLNRRRFMEAVHWHKSQQLEDVFMYSLLFAVSGIYRKSLRS